MSDDDADAERESSFLGALSIIGLLSFCCIGLAAIVGGATAAGGAAGTTTAVVGAATPRGTLVSALVTAATVFVVALVTRWHFG